MSTYCYKLVIQFDGTHYAGWQSQKQVVGVQQKIEAVLDHLYATKGVRLEGSGRTDAGVHAFGLSASFVPPCFERFDGNKLRKGLNALLPADIRIREAVRVHRDFHARFSCVGKTYLYFIDNSVSGSPILRNFSWHMRKSLNFDAMLQAASYLEGKQDYSAFTVMRKNLKGHAVRTVYKCGIFRMGNFIVIHVTGDGFLYKMVRSIAGYLVECGLGKFRPEDTKQVLTSGKREEGGVTAPALGLFLGQNYYQREDMDAFLHNNPRDFVSDCFFDFCPE